MQRLQPQRALQPSTTGDATETVGEGTIGLGRRLCIVAPRATAAGLGTGGSDYSTLFTADSCTICGGR